MEKENKSEEESFQFEKGYGEDVVEKRMGELLSSEERTLVEKIMIPLYPQLLQVSSLGLSSSDTKNLLNKIEAAIGTVEAQVIETGDYENVDMEDFKNRLGLLLQKYIDKYQPVEPESEDKE